ncbi:MAG: acyl-CoA synthetase [Magnetospirillum sp.]|nr:acyl-CoA synthetase [Magnetospirillum sp.]
MPQKQHGGGLNKGVVLMILAALVPFSLPTVVVLFFTMLPTLAAWGTEKGPHKYAWLCVGGLNLSGVIPYLFGLWFGIHNLDAAFDLLSDATVLLVAYGTSAIGWLIYMVMPPLVASWLSYTSERRVAAMKAAQKKLIERWGDEVGKKPQPAGAAPAGVE